MPDGCDQRLSGAQDADSESRNESTPLHANVLDTGTLRLIIAFFFGFSVIVTIVLGIQVYYGNGNSQNIFHGSVVSDYDQCSRVGFSMMKDGGNAVDAIIATAFCMGVVNPHITGLGSGGFMLIYDQRKRKLLNAIDFRVTRSDHSRIGIPGFVAGLQLAHQLYGSLPWKDLVYPAQIISTNGFFVTSTLKKSASVLHVGAPYNERLTSFLSNVGERKLMVNPELGKTLSIIAESGSSGFYNITLFNVLHELRKLKEFWNLKDIINYKALKSSGMKGSFLHYDLIGPGHGSGGPILLNNLKLINNSLSPLVSAVEGFKLVAFNRNESFGSHIAAMDGNDVYVTMVSGLGSVLGSQILTESGFTLNNMPQTSPDKTQRPEILITPIIALQNNKICGRRLLLGGGDVRDVVQALVYLLRDEDGNIKESIEAPRVRIFTPQIYLDESRIISPRDYKLLFEDSDLKIVNSTAGSSLANLFPSINVAQKINDVMTAHADSRGSGRAVIY